MRVLLLELPQLLRDILEEAIRTRGDLELHEGTRRALQVPPEHTAPPDAVILGLTAAEDVTLVPALFARWPGARVMTVLPAGEEAVVYELRPHERTLGQLSPGGLVESLRESIHRDRTRAPGL